MDLGDFFIMSDILFFGDRIFHSNFVNYLIVECK